MNLSGNPSRRRAAFLASRARGGGRIAPIARRTVVVALRAGGNRAERQQDSCQVRRRPRPPADAHACPPVLGKSKCKLDRLPYIYGQELSRLFYRFIPAPIDTSPSSHLTMWRWSFHRQ